MKRINILTTLIVITISAIIMSCGSTAPFQERDAALKSIELAKSVDSSKYASDEISEAEADYSMGEELIQPEEKSSQNADAKNKYISADNKAQDAYQKSLAPYTESFIRRTDEEIESARKIKANVTHQELFDNGVSKNEQAKEQLKTGNYDSARVGSLEAYDQIKMAKDKTLALKEQVDGLKDEYIAGIDELRNNKAEAAIPNEYHSTVENFNTLEGRYSEGYYEELLTAYPEGTAVTQEQLELIEEKRMQAAKDLEKAETSIEEAQRKIQTAESTSNE